MYSQKTKPEHDCSYVVLWRVGKNPFARHYRVRNGKHLYYDCLTNKFEDNAPPPSYCEGLTFIVEDFDG